MYILVYSSRLNPQRKAGERSKLNLEQRLNPLDFKQPVNLSLFSVLLVVTSSWAVSPSLV